MYSEIFFTLCLVAGLSAVGLITATMLGIAANKIRV